MPTMESIALRRQSVCVALVDIVWSVIEVDFEKVRCALLNEAGNAFLEITSSQALVHPRGGFIHGFTQFSVEMLVNLTLHHHQRHWRGSASHGFDVVLGFSNARTRFAESVSVAHAMSFFCFKFA